MDCLSVTKVLHNPPLTASKVLIDAEGVKEKRFGVNAIHRRAYYFQINKFKHIQHSIITEMYKIAVYALHDGIKFFRFSKRDKCPQRMHTLKRIMWRFTELDE